MVQAADRHYEPGKFTTFPAYKWSAGKGNSLSSRRESQPLHRNVIKKGGAEHILPFDTAIFIVLHGILRSIIFYEKTLLDLLNCIVLKEKLLNLGFV